MKCGIFNNINGELKLKIKALVEGRGKLYSLSIQAMLKRMAGRGGENGENRVKKESLEGADGSGETMEELRGEREVAMLRQMTLRCLLLRYCHCFCIMCDEFSSSRLPLNNFITGS